MSDLTYTPITAAEAKALLADPDAYQSLKAGAKVNQTRMGRRRGEVYVCVSYDRRAKAYAWFTAK